MSTRKLDQYQDECPFCGIHDDSHCDAPPSAPCDKVLTRLGREQSSGWAEAQRIADLPSVTEVLLGFSEDSTNDNAVCLVQEVLKAHRTEVLAELSDESAMWTINEQIKGLLEGDGASEDHEAVVDFLLGAGLPLDTVKRVHKALSCAEKPPALTELQKDATNLMFALRDAWPYVHDRCTIDSVKTRISALIRKHGDFSDITVGSDAKPQV